MICNQSSFEQIALSRLLEVTWEEFDKSLLSAGARFVLWGSFSDPTSLAKSYFRAKGKDKLVDGRRTEKSRSTQENDLVIAVNSAAEDVYEYLKWARNNGGGQPILREALVSYCTAFEACLKNIAVVFLLAKSIGLDGIAFIPNKDFKRALKTVNDSWKKRLEDSVARPFRAKVFYQNFLVNENPSPDNYPFSFLLNEDTAWSNCWAAFDLRNAIVHQMGRLDEQATLGDSVFSASQEIEIEPKHLSVAASAMRELVGPISPHYLLPL